MLLVVCKFIVFALLMIVCAMLLLLVLMQRPKQEGLGAAFGAQMTDQAFGARTTDVLKKGTIFFGSLFMILCFLLSVLIQNEHSNHKVTSGSGDKQEEKSGDNSADSAKGEQSDSNTDAQNKTEGQDKSGAADDAAKSEPNAEKQ